MKTFVLAVFLLCCFLSHAQEISIIPKPVRADWRQGNFVISRSTVLVASSPAEEKSAAFLNDYLSRFYGFRLKTATQPATNYISLHTSTSVPPAREGQYTLQVNPQSVSISGSTGQGTFYGVQTLIQLLPVQVSNSLKIPAVSIEDYPRFQYRGLMLDAGRHFFPVSFVKKYIDFIALHKLNYFHWHLTEDQGWRIEIKKYPKLTETGSCRDGTIIGHYPGTGNDNIHYCGFYTQDEIREVVQYAADRFITVVPEIEMPGHSSAALASYPYLGCTGGPYQVKQTWGVFKDVYCAGNDSTFQFLQDVLDEVFTLFPSKFIHIGGDECPKDSWKACPKCQQRIKDNNLKDERELQSYFVQRIEKYINSKGRTMIGWDEILEGGLAPNATVMSWRGEDGGIAAAKDHHDVIMTPGKFVYLDHAQTKNEDSVTIGGYLPLQTVYGYEPIPQVLSPEESKYILGAQGNVWTEYMGNPAKVEYMIFPRLSALSEVLWSPKEQRDWQDFSEKNGNPVQAIPDLESELQ